jgi:predicted alpha-1,6-mannanase (GH76 family)
MLFSILSSSLLLAATTSALPTELEPRATNQNQYLTNSHTAITELQTFYNSPRPGFWSAGWWNTANCLTLLADLRAKDSSSFLTSITDGPNGVFKHTLSSQGKDSTGALNWDDFFDDQLWWVVALIKTYDVTKDVSFLKTANVTFSSVNLNNKPSNNPCGGLANAYPSEKYLVKSSTIATVLYVEAAALLATRYPAQSTYFINLAKTQWSWLTKNILIDGIMQGDGLTGSPPSCGNNHAFLTYIEGVALQALVALYHATNDASYLTTADTLATKLLSGKYGMMDTNKIAQEFCDADASCNPDTAQFKGIMMRGLRTLRDAKPDAAGGQIKLFLARNADSIWANSRQSGSNLLGEKWAGPFALGSSQALQLSSHSSATMALVQAALSSM